jgi:hypothetical protein
MTPNTKQSLFRVRSLRTDYWFDELTNLLSSRKIFYPSIDQLNDPIDCQISIRENNDAEIFLFYEKYKAEITGRRRRAGKSRFKLDLMHDVYKANLSICKQSQLTNRILSLTERIGNNAIWSHYGDGLHRRNNNTVVSGLL